MIIMMALFLPEIVSKKNKQRKTCLLLQCPTNSHRPKSWKKNDIFWCRPGQASIEYKAIPLELHSLDASYREKQGFSLVHALLCTVSQRLNPLSLLTILAYSWNPGYTQCVDSRLCSSGTLTLELDPSILNVDLTWHLSRPVKTMKCFQIIIWICLQLWKMGSTNLLKKNYESSFFTGKYIRRRHFGVFSCFFRIYVNLWYTAIKDIFFFVCSLWSLILVEMKPSLFVLNGTFITCSGGSHH